MTSTDAFNPWRIHAAGFALIAGLGAFAYLAQIGPVLDRREETRAQQTYLIAERSKTQEMERSLRQLAAQLEAVRRETAGFNVKLEPAGELNQRMARLTELAAKNGLQVDTMESGVTTSSQRYSTVAVQFSGRGGYRNAAALLRQLHTDMPDIGVASLQLISRPGNNGTSATFVFDLLWYTAPAAAPAKK